MHDHDFRQQTDAIFGPEGMFLQYAVMHRLHVFDARVAPHLHNLLHEQLNPTFARRNVNAMLIEPVGSVEG